MSSTRTCLDCGFLTIKNEGNELTMVPRAVLATCGQGPANEDYIKQTDCYKGRWGFDLDYSGDPPLDAVFEEVKRPRKKCRGFEHYEAGLTPAEHKERQEERRRERFQWRVAKLGFWGALVGALIGSGLPHLPSWLASAWQWIRVLIWNPQGG